MKKIQINLALILMTLVMGFTSCIKQDSKTITDTQLEFDATVLNSPAVGKTFPILTRVPLFGVAANTSNPTITRTSGAIKFRVNLIGAQTNTARTYTYAVVAAETTAVSGTHFTTSGTFVVPANSSFGEITVNVINPGVSSATPVNLVLELKDAGDAKAATNYKLLGMSISQL